MKKILSLLLCVMIVISFAACGKKDEEPKDTTEVLQSEDVTKDDKAEESAESSEDEASSESTEGETSGETQVLPPASAEDLEEMVNEFNTTDDPERKEELRKELEEFLKQAEAMAQ